MCKLSKKKFPQLDDKIKNKNFLSLNLKKTFGEKLSIIGNFPYNISNKIFSKIINDRDCIEEVIGMFQKEVAERICSKKGKNRGLTVLWFRLSLTAKYVLMWKKKIFPQLQK